MIQALVSFAVSSIIAYSKGASSVSAIPVNSFFTDPERGTQTLAGRAFDQINAEFLEFRDRGQATPELIQVCIDAIETVRMRFQLETEALPQWFRGAGGAAVRTINKAAAIQTAALQDEMAKLGGGTAGGWAGLPTGTSEVWLWIVLVIVAAWFVLARK